MNRAENTKDKLRDAANALATGEGDIKDRLRNALIYHFSYVERQYLGTQLQPIYDRVISQSRKKPRFKGDSIVEAALYRMRKKTAARIATDVWEIFRSVYRVY